VRFVRRQRAKTLACFISSRQTGWPGIYLTASSSDEANPAVERSSLNALNDELRLNSRRRAPNEPTDGRLPTNQYARCAASDAQNTDTEKHRDVVDETTRDGRASLLLLSNEIWPSVASRSLLKPSLALHSALTAGSGKSGRPPIIAAGDVVFSTMRGLKERSQVK